MGRFFSPWFSGGYNSLEDYPSESHLPRYYLGFIVLGFTGFEASKGFGSILFFKGALFELKDTLRYIDHHGRITSTFSVSRLPSPTPAYI